MTVIGIVGLPGSGKSEASNVAREMSIPVVTMGDVVREATTNRGLDPATDHGRVATELREEEGPAAIADRSLPILRSILEGNDAVVVDGIRSDHEARLFEDVFGEDFYLVEISAPREIRAERLADRGRDRTTAEGGEDLADREKRELGFGMREAMERADRTVENADSLESFRNRIRALFEEVRDR